MAALLLLFFSATAYPEEVVRFRTKPEDKRAGELFGSAVSVHGMFAMVGSPYDNLVSVDMPRATRLSVAAISPSQHKITADAGCVQGIGRCHGERKALLYPFTC